MRAADFSSSIGVGTHSTYYDTAYGYNSGQNILSDLKYLGATQIRDGLDVTAHGGLIEQLMAAGIKDDMVAGTFGNGVPAQTIAAYIANLETFEADDPGGVNSVEGFNEVSAANLPATLKFQAQLYAAIKADPKLAGISLYNYTGSSENPSFYKAMGNVSSTADYGNTHTYNEYFPPELWNSWFVPLGLGGMPNAPYVVTETGYDTSQLPADIAAKQTLNDVLDLIHDGASKVYLYELLDEKPDPAMTDSQQHFGLFNIDNTPKPAAVALHNLNAILADPGATAATFVPGTLAYSVTGLNSAPVDRAALQAAFGYGIFQSYIASLPAYGNSMLFAKSNGTFDLAVWQEPMIYDGVNRIASPVTSVTVTLGQVAGLVKVFDPLIGTAPIATYANVGQVTLQVTDHALVVEIDPAAPPTMTAAAALPTLIGAGPDTLALSVSEDAYKGNALFTISVDGIQQGGIQTAMALHGAGASQAFDVAGQFGTGQHAVTVSFLNDAWDGTPDTDRNLYVTAASLDGQTIAGAALTEMSSGPQQFSFSTTPVITGLSAGSDTGWSATDAVTNDATPTVAGTAMAAATVTLYDGKVALGASVATASGNWAITTPALTAGAHNLTAVATNPAGQASAASSVKTVVIAVTAPVVSSIAATASSASAHQGQAINLVLATSEAVAVSTSGGTPSLALSTGGTATYDAAHSTANTLAFKTTVAAGQSSADLLVTGLALNGASVTDVAGNALTTGGVPLLAGASTGIAIVTATPAVALGSGPDILALAVSEDAYLGDAQFTISVNGAQVGGIQTAVALHGAATSQVFDVAGAFHAAQNVVSIDFLNDLWAGTPSTDRNLYVTSASLDGQVLPGAALTEMGAGPQQMTFLGPTATALTLHLAEDAWLGDANYAVSIDGAQVGSGTATALNSQGQSQGIGLRAMLSAGAHDVGVSFLNDAWGGTPATDRNLYVKGIDVAGSPQIGSAAALMGASTEHFQVFVQSR